jgi:hypothetical protein
MPAPLLLPPPPFWLVPVPMPAPPPLPPPGRHFKSSGGRKPSASSTRE